MKELIYKIFKINYVKIFAEGNVRLAKVQKIGSYNVIIYGGIYYLEDDGFIKPIYGNDYTKVNKDSYPWKWFKIIEEGE